MTYDELAGSKTNAIIASMLNIQVAFDDDKLLPGMAFDEQCTFYLKLIENEQYFGNREKENCEAQWPITGNFSDVTKSFKTFAIPLPLLSEENSYFGVTIKLDPAEGTWVGFGDNCKYSTVYKKANREIMAIYSLEDDNGNFQQPTEKRKMNLCIRLEHSDPEETSSKLWLTEYDLLPAEESWDDGPQFKSFLPRAKESIGSEEALNIKDSYEAVKDELSMIKDPIKIDSKYEISDWGSLSNNEEQIFGENRGLTVMAAWLWPVGGLLGITLLVVIIYIVYRCCKRSENDPMKLPSGTRNSYAAGNSKSPE